MDSLSFNAMPAFESVGSFQVDQASIQEARDMLYAASTTDVGRGPPPPPPPDHMITGDRKRKLDDDEKKRKSEEMLEIVKSRMEKRFKDTGKF